MPRERMARGPKMCGPKPVNTGEESGPSDKRGRRQRLLREVRHATLMFLFSDSNRHVAFGNDSQTTGVDT
jgi:hypothetical protein